MKGTLNRIINWEQTHFRFTKLEHGSERFGPCQDCEKENAGVFYMFTYGHSFQNPAGSGIAYINDVFCCEKCKDRRLQFAKEKNLKEWTRKSQTQV